MNLEQLKAAVEQFRRNLNEGEKFAVMGESAAVIEGAATECNYLLVAVAGGMLPWYQRYGEMETRLEGTWIGNSTVKIYNCYNAEHVINIGGIPCQYTKETNPFQDDPMADRPEPKLSDFEPELSQSGRILKMADILSEAMTLKDGFVHVSPEAIERAKQVARQAPNRSDAGGHDRAMRDMIRGPVIIAGEPVIRRLLKEPQPFASRGIIVSPPTPDLVLSAKNVDFGDVVGDYLMGGMVMDVAMENPSAAASLIRRPRLFPAAEYRGRLVRCSQEQMKFTDDPVHNRRQFNSASMRVKITYLRRLAAYEGTVAKESLTERCIKPMKEG